MSESCNHDCKSCGENCSQRTSPENLLVPPNGSSCIRRVVGVVSGKGGVGKSAVTSMLAALLNRRGYAVGILDADVTGPSIPKMFSVTGRALGSDEGVFPAESRQGIKIMSVNLLLERETDPVVWRGPIIAGTVTQFWTDVVWGDLDFLFVDMPPGTGDVPLTVFQSLPVDGIIVVASPQELVSMIVQKAVNMARRMNIPIIGAVENYSYLVCPDCGKKIRLFGESHIDEAARAFGIDVLAKLPLDPAVASLCDKGEIESFQGGWLDHAADVLAQTKGKR